MQIKDKKALVTGAASALGLVFTRELLRNGAATVLMLDAQETAGELAAERLNLEFGQKRTLFIKCDVSKSSEFDAAFKEAVSILGGLDILVNNSETINELDFNKAIDVNVTAVIRGTMMGIQQMGRDFEGKGGVVVNVASTLGLEAFPPLPVYTTTKHAVVSFSRSFAHPYHYRRTGVRIIMLCPGLSATVGTLMENLTTDNIENMKEFTTAMENVPLRRVESVAHGLMYVIRCARNGSIWISENEKPVYEIQMPSTLPIRSKEETH